LKLSSEVLTSIFGTKNDDLLITLSFSSMIRAFFSTWASEPDSKTQQTNPHYFSGPDLDLRPVSVIHSSREHALLAAAVNLTHLNFCQTNQSISCFLRNENVTLAGFPTSNQLFSAI
jgi:hypothetical protein